ncbi:MAG: DNA starvation/stationary phase protection protein [Bacteroidetes bacterium]|nr:DNA starvation/stationary phase protection protein [Bacteroidota bacterium]
MEKDKLILKIKKILADSYAVYLKTQNYHWNVTSHHAFSSLHLMFQSQYEELAEAIDDIAEKIRQLGAKTPGGFAAFQKLTTIIDGNENASADEMIKDLANDQQHLINVVNEGIKISYDCKDEGTADLLIERLRAHDKNKWMLQSSL